MTGSEKKLKMPPVGRRIKPSSVLLIPSVDGMLSDALSIVGVELAKLKRRSDTLTSLDTKDAKILQGYIKSLVDLSKESRERDKEDGDLEKLTDQELIALLQAPKESDSGKIKD